MGGWSVRPSIDLTVYVTTRTTNYLLAQEAVPTSQAIERLRCKCWGRCSSPALFVSIASGLTGLYGIDWSIYDFYLSINPVERRKKRYGKCIYSLPAAAPAISSCVPSLRKFNQILRSNYHL